MGFFKNRGGKRVLIGGSPEKPHLMARERTTMTKEIWVPKKRKNGNNGFYGKNNELDHANGGENRGQRNGIQEMFIPPKRGKKKLKTCLWNVNRVVLGLGKGAREKNKVKKVQFTPHRRPRGNFLKKTGTGG